MRKRVSTAAGIFAFLLLFGCGDSGPERGTQVPPSLVGKWALEGAEINGPVHVFTATGYLPLGIETDPATRAADKNGKIVIWTEGYNNEEVLFESWEVKDGRLPACLVGNFKNESSEHIDTSLISKSMEAAIVNSGKLDFVAGGETRLELRNERQDQQSNASEDTASSLGYERAANFLLTGVVKSIVERSGNTTIRSYFVSAELTNGLVQEPGWFLHSPCSFSPYGLRNMRFLAEVV